MDSKNNAISTCVPSSLPKKHAHAQGGRIRLVDGNLPSAWRHRRRRWRGAIGKIRQRGGERRSLEIALGETAHPLEPDTHSHHTLQWEAISHTRTHTYPLDARPAESTGPTCGSSSWIQTRDQNGDNLLIQGFGGRRGPLCPAEAAWELTCCAHLEAGAMLPTVLIGTCGCFGVRGPETELFLLNNGVKVSDMMDPVLWVQFPQIIFSSPWTHLILSQRAHRPGVGPWMGCFHSFIV